MTGALNGLVIGGGFDFPMGAQLVQTALHTVSNDDATVEQSGMALINDPAPRMALMGQCMAFHVACDKGRMVTDHGQFGTALKLPWTRLEATEHTRDLRDKMVDGCQAISTSRHIKDMAVYRERDIVAVLNEIQQTKANSH